MVYIDDDGGDVDAEVTAGDDDHAELKDGVHFEQLQVTLGPGYCADNFICHPPGVGHSTKKWLNVVSQVRIS